MEYSVHSGFETLALSPRNTEKLKLVVDERINASLLVTYSGTWESLQVEVIASPYSSLTLMLKNDGSEDVVLQVSGSVHRDASLTLALCELNAGNTQARVTLDLCEEGAFAMLRSACIAASRKQFHMQCNHLQAHTEGPHGKLCRRGRRRTVSHGGHRKIIKGARESNSHQKTRVLTMSERHSSEVCLCC